MTDEPEEDVTETIDLCLELGVTVHVRGTDASPVVEFRDRWTRRVVGGTELRARMADERTREFYRARGRRGLSRRHGTR